MRTQREIIDGLPVHLRSYVAEQDYSRYSAKDQAGWRFLMRNLSRRLRHTAHPVYLEGLQRTGISLDYIPKVDEMNHKLAALGWSALVVDGFVPPAIFMEFQALRILVIAVDMRRSEHLLYTPAPDIVHESAGHAPFLIDVDYAEFLQRFGEVGMRALHTSGDMAVYQAIRELSIIKEQHDSSAEDIAAAHARLDEAYAELGEPSEAALLSRLHWWTVEYGLVGECDDYAIFGAGLLSSLAESNRCIDDQVVRKVPLTLDAIRTPYDITSPQPQLFVTKSCRHLTQVLEQFAEGMAFTRGGAASVQKAIDCASVATLEYDTGLQVSGLPTTARCNAMGDLVYIGTTGPTQLSFRGKQIHGHGVDRHPEGFGSPVGSIKDITRCLSSYSVDELKQFGVAVGEQVVLEFVSGITVSGRLQNIWRAEHKNLLLTFIDCRVTSLDGDVLFAPEWGEYDMAVGTKISSVFGGWADRTRCTEMQVVKSTSGNHSEDRPELLDCYAQVAALRHTARPDANALWQHLGTRYPDEWLLLADLRAVPKLEPSLVSEIDTALQDVSKRIPQSREPIVLDSCSNDC